MLSAGDSVGNFVGLGLLLLPSEDEARFISAGSVDNEGD